MVFWNHRVEIERIDLGNEPPLSVAYDSMLMAEFFRSLVVAARQPFARWLRNVGMAIAAMIPMIATTMSNSMREKPRVQ